MSAGRGLGASATRPTTPVPIVLGHVNRAPLERS